MSVFPLLVIVFPEIIFASLLLEGSRYAAANGTERTATAAPITSDYVTLLFHEPSVDIYNSSSEFNDTLFNLKTRYNTLPIRTYGVENVSTLEYVDALLKHDNTVEFLASFKSDFERKVIFSQLRACPYIELCGFSLNLTIQSDMEYRGCESCSCAYPDCLITRTCCPDIIFQNEDSRKTESVGDLTQKTLAQKECVALNIPNRKNEGAFGYGNCPAATSQSGAEKCVRIYNSSSSMTDIVPVMNKKTLDLYRNKYCAYCHGVNDSEFEYLQAEINCFTGSVLNDEDDIIYTVLAKNRCYLNFTSQKLNKCSVSISRCNETGLWIYYDQDVEKACNLYRSVVKYGSFTSDRFYQNVFCVLCNVNEASETSNPPFTQNNITISIKYPFSGLLKMDSDASVEESKPVDNKCSINQLYDKITQTCKELFCSKIMRLHDGRCSAVFKKISSGVIYTSYIRLVPTRDLSIEDAYFTADGIIRFFENSSDLCGMQLVYQSDSDVNQGGLSSVLKSRLSYFDARIQLFPRHSHDPVSFTGLIRSLHNTILTLESPFATERQVSFQILIRDDDTSEFNMISQVSNSEDLNDGVPPEDSIPLSTLVQQYKIMSDLNLTRFAHQKKKSSGCNYTSDTLLHKVLILNPCPKVNISKRDVLWKVLDDGLLFEQGWYKIESDSFYFTDNMTIAMCADLYIDFTYKANLKRMSTETIVSVICCSLSIICLLFTFIIYCIFPKLRRSVPGKNTMLMAFSLLCAQTLYLVSSLGGFEKGSLECKIVGICVHFSWLVAMFWMNVCTYHIFRALMRTKVVSQSPGIRRILWYHLYTMIMATIFVSINITVSHFYYGNVGYGRSVCYISSGIMMIFSFCIPISFVVLSDICMFLFVVVALKKSPSVQKNVQNKRNDLVVFIKLSTITGATWIFGILNVWLKFSALSYIFILLNASQGVFILFAFVANRRVYDLFRQGGFCLARAT